MKVALVTGASRGIGAAIAKRLATSGYAVGINYLTHQAKAQQVADEICQAGGKAVLLPADLADEVSLLKMFNTLDEKLGHLDVLINNAGINGGNSTVDQITRERLEQVFAVNVYATFLCSREALKRMKKNQQGAIINITSEAARFGGKNMAHYAAAKAAVNTFTIGFAREAGPYNIRVNAVSPGVINTDMYRDVSEQDITFLKNSLPLGRMGAPAEVAELVDWLASPQASYISGAIIPVAGAR